MMLHFILEIPDILNQLKEMETDGLLTISSNKIVVGETGFCSKYLYGF
jgi:hypothetical protein